MNTEVFELVSILRTSKCYSPVFSPGAFFNSSFKRTVGNFSCYLLSYTGYPLWKQKPKSVLTATDGL